MNWDKQKLDKKCDQCPFAFKGPGYNLRRTLRGIHWEGILANLSKGGHFFCHKTTKETGNGTMLICAGALEWQTKRNIEPDAIQVIERLKQVFKRTS